MGFFIWGPGSLAARGYIILSPRPLPACEYGAVCLTGFWPHFLSTAPWRPWRRRLVAQSAGFRGARIFWGVHRRRTEALGRKSVVGCVLRTTGLWRKRAGTPATTRLFMIYGWAIWPMRSCFEKSAVGCALRTIRRPSSGRGRPPCVTFQKLWVSRGVISDCPDTKPPFKAGRRQKYADES